MSNRSSDLDRLASKAVSDATFRDQLLKDPLAAAQSVGVRLSADQVAKIQNADQQQVDAAIAQLQGGASLDATNW